MTTPNDHPPIEAQIARWRDDVRRRLGLDGPDADALERRLRDQMAALAAAGLAPDEALLIAARRVGGSDALPREAVPEHARPAETAVAIGLAVAAALAIKVPALFGVEFGEGGAGFYTRNASLFALPLLAGYLAWKRGLDARRCGWLALAFAGAALVANAFPFQADSQTGVLTALHLPIALWLAVGVAYAGGGGFSGSARMDFVRFSGEIFIHYVLIALGGAVLIAFTMTMFDAIGVNAEPLAEGWLLPCGAAGAVLVSAWLVDTRQRVTGNLAPVLTRLFTPLFTFVVLAFLATAVWTGSPIDVGRNVLIGFDLLLVLVVGLVLYAASARERRTTPDAFDRLQLLLIVSALVVDVMALAAIASRISEFGFTPNRVAALGENLILLVNLAGSAWLYAQFLRGGRPFAALERWQVGFLPLYSAWAALVAAVFPPIFAYA